MKDLKHIKKFNESEENLNISDVRISKKINEQLENHDEKERLEYERGIELYKKGLENIEETLWNLQKEVNHLKDMVADIQDEIMMLREKY